MTREESFWEAATGDALRQGEYLLNCPVPIFKERPILEQPDQSVVVRTYDLIIVTQSCDLEQGKIQFPSICWLTTLKPLDNAGA